jgi:hypothetical protein
MRTILIALLLASVAAPLAAAATADDAATAKALVLTRRDVPIGWNDEIDPNPCRPLGKVGGDVSARAASRWGELTIGVWSIAEVATTASGAKALYRRTAASLPGCVARAWKRKFPFAAKGTVTLEPQPLKALGDESGRWRVTVTPTKGDPGVFDVVVVRKGRAVVQYVSGTAGSPSSSGRSHASRAPARRSGAVDRLAHGPAGDRDAVRHPYLQLARPLEAIGLVQRQPGERRSQH